MSPALVPSPEVVRPAPPGLGPPDRVQQDRFLEAGAEVLAPQPEANVPRQPTCHVSAPRRIHDAILEGTRAARAL